jgi:hypothetical protein
MEGSEMSAIDANDINLKALFECNCIFSISSILLLSSLLLLNLLG